MPVIERISTTGAVADRLRSMIADGDLAPGGRINEVHLSRELGVSRTPLREALARLAPEGAVGHAPNIGYFVKPLTLAEFEPAGIPSRDRIERLADLNEKLEASTDVTETLNLDDAWHRELLAGCPNFILLELVEQFMLRTRRYEVALMRERPQVSAAVGEHRTILRALGAGDLSAACKALRDNLTRGAGPMRAWLEGRK
jgi:DNA-binding GntR family transcriptional regulator